MKTNENNIDNNQAPILIFPHINIEGGGSEWL